ncbi:hypothetical protein CPC08DRAFT_723314 [Agrocybe pediades]|nr:hypothetical protein CPC08DRAFT_723314 [Agrocybe pediades]
MKNAVNNNNAAGPVVLLTDEVIEIESSPEPETMPRAREAAAAASGHTTTATAGASSSSPLNKGKGKARAKSRATPKKAAAFSGPVIELTDSDSDLDMPPSQTRSTQRARPKPGHPTASGSSQALHPLPIAVSASLENIPGPSSSKKRKGNEGAPLFLPSQSDEENEPPPFVRVEGGAAGRQRKRAHSEENGEERVQTRDKGKGKAKEEDDDDFDPEFSAKPFPDFFERVQERAKAAASGSVDGGKEKSATPGALFQDVKIIQPLRPVPPIAPAAAPNPPTVTHPVPVAVPAPVQEQHVQPQPPAPVPNHATLPQQQPPQLPQPPQEREPQRAPPPPPEPQPIVDPASHVVAQVLEIVPDVDPDHLLALVQTHLPNFAAHTTEHVVGILFENGDYPKVDRRNKGKRKAEDEPEAGGSNSPNKRPRVEQEPEVDYGSDQRAFTGGPHYVELALIQLQTSFPLIPKPFLRKLLQERGNLYAPTHLAILAAEKKLVTLHRQLGGDIPYEEFVQAHRMRAYNQKATPYNNVKDRRKVAKVVDDEYVKERRWLLDKLNDPIEAQRDLGLGVGVPGEGGAVATAVAAGSSKGKEKAVETEPTPVEEGTGIECQCCFSEYAFYAATKLGEHDIRIVCMHSSGCSLPFPVSELKRILSPKLMSLYERVEQQKELEAAGLEGLEECPFCDWKCVLEVSKEEEKLFRCGNEEGGCGVVSCRTCKKKDHLPKSCKEAEDDKLLDGRHAIEEAMTRALMRNCPKCMKPFIKEQGVISGYEHFDQTPAGMPSTSRSKGKCPLFDHVEERHANEVKAAAEKAMEQYKRDHPDVDEKDIKVDLPPPPPSRQVLQPGVPVPGVVGAVPVYGAVHVHRFHYNGQEGLVPAPAIPAPRRGRGRGRGRGHPVLPPPVIPPPVVPAPAWRAYDPAQLQAQRDAMFMEERRRQREVQEQLEQMRVDRERLLLERQREEERAQAALRAVAENNRRHAELLDRAQARARAQVEHVQALARARAEAQAATVDMRYDAQMRTRMQQLEQRAAAQHAETMRAAAEHQRIQGQLHAAAAARAGPGAGVPPQAVNFHVNILPPANRPQPRAGPSRSRK